MRKLKKMDLHNSPDKYIKKITSLFKSHANTENAPQMKRYMRNQFEFFGIKSPLRREICSCFFKTEFWPDYKEVGIVTRKLWQLPEREYQYVAVELLGKYRKQISQEIIHLLVYIITHKSWWDTVDGIAKNLVGEYFKHFPDTKGEIIDQWIQSGNIWLQRTTLLHQLGYKRNTDIHLLFELIERLKGIDEFFIQKAIGWSLREYSKVNPEVVKKYIKDHQLSPLSKREGMKAILRSKR